MENNILENEVLRVVLHPSFPAIREVRHKPTNETVPGYTASEGCRIEANGRIIEADCISHGEGSYRVSSRSSGLDFTSSFSLDKGEIVWRTHNIAATVPLRTLHFPENHLITADQEWNYRQKYHLQRAWDQKIAPGLWRAQVASGSVGSAIPGGPTPPTTFACLWNNSLCITAASSQSIKPMTLQFSERDFPNRAGSASLGMGPILIPDGKKIPDAVEFRLAFLQDLNGDGKVDYGDAALWYRRRIEDANPIYREAFVYKVICAAPGRGPNTFDRCLDLIKRVNMISDGIPQIVYLVGWQYSGHDTGYPALDVVNPTLGGEDGLTHLVQKAQEYNATISYHINVDDAYEVSPAWDPDIMTVNPDGSVREWERFNNLQSYHISHTKDVRSGKLYERLNKMFSVAPVDKSIHIDAFRITNASWEPKGYTGMSEELEYGMKPILEFFRTRGIDPSCESIDYCPADLADIFSMVWHTSDPLLHFGKVFGGGRGENFTAWALGNSADTDLIPEMTFERIADMIYLGTRLYQLYLTKEVLDLRLDDPCNLSMAFDGGGIMHANSESESLSVIWNGIEVARDFDRFIPSGDDQIHAYSRYGGSMEWQMPVAWHERPIQLRMITPEGIVPGPEHRVSDGMISFRALPHRPIILTAN